MYDFSDSAIVLENKNKIIMGNTKNGKWIKISKKEFEILTKIIKEKTIENAYIKKINVLCEQGILIPSGKIEEIEEKLDSIMIAITNRCNLNCVHCGFSAGIENNEHLFLEDILDIINKNRNINSITITGGEPLIHPDFFEIAKYLGANFFGKKILMTNATLINNKNLDLITTNFNSISISVDAATKDTCDYMRGEGVFLHIMNIVKNLKSNGCDDISLSFVITDYNKDEVEKFIEMCNKLDVKPMLRDLFLVGRSKDNEDKLKLNETFKKKNEVVIQNIQECRKHVHLNGKCSAGRNSLYIQYDGAIYPCPVAAVNSHFTMINIKDIRSRDLQEVINKRNNYKGFCNFNDISCEKVSPCSKCNVNKFCWACIQEYYTFIFNEKERQEFCKEQKAILEEIVWGD